MGSGDEGAPEVDLIAVIEKGLFGKALVKSSIAIDKSQLSPA